MTKKEIYANYNIEYKNGKILSPIGFINPLLKEGNSKVGKKCFTFSLPAGINGTCVCNCKNCYALTGFYCMKSVKESLKLNQTIIENHLDFARRAIQAQIIADKITMIRIHAAGDFKTANSTEYAQLWKDIVKDNPAVKFWTYTKMPQYESMFDSFDNANIVPSVLPFNLGFNFGTCEQLLKMYETMKKHGITPHICECGTNEKHHCETCAGCSLNKYVLFILHSTKEYDAKKDSLLSDVAAIIDAQKTA